MTKYVLITVKNILGVKIVTEVFSTREEAFQAMKKALYDRLKLDSDNADKDIEMLEGGIEFSNAILNKNSAYIYQDFGETFHHWKIIEV